MVMIPAYQDWYRKGFDAGRGIGGFYEDIITAADQHILNPGDFALDGGANHGAHTGPMSPALAKQGWSQRLKLSLPWPKVSRRSRIRNIGAIHESSRRHWAHQKVKLNSCLFLQLTATADASSNPISRKRLRRVSKTIKSGKRPSTM